MLSSEKKNKNKKFLLKEYARIVTFLVLVNTRVTVLHGQKKRRYTYNYNLPVRTPLSTRTLSSNQNNAVRLLFRPRLNTKTFLYARKI